MDRNKKWLFLGAILIMLCVMLPNYYVTGADDKPLTNSSFYFVGDGSKVVKIGEKLEITMNKTQLILTTEAGMPVDYTIEWHTSNDQIVTIQRDPSSANIVELQRKGPGFATISARIVGGGKIYTAYMYVVVDLKIKEKPDQTSPSYTELKQIKTTKEKAMILKYDPSKTNNEKKPIVLEFVSQPEIINNDFVQWETTDDKIVTVDKQGIVTPVGAGTATIKIKTNTTSSSEESIELSLLVVVEPLANITPYDPTPTWNDKGVITMNSSDFNISSNAIYADNLTWRVMDSYGNILPKDSKLLNYTISKSNGNLEVTNAKVGVYRIQAFAAKDFDKDTQVGYIDLTVIVPLLVPSKVIMNVGDTYDLVDNFNFSSPEDITTLETDSSNIVVPYKSKGSLVANSRGIATVKMSYLAYDANSSSGVSQKTITFQVEVIDGISLSATDTIIYTGGSILLTAKVTNNAAKIYWTTSNNSIATVEDGLVTGISEGECIISAYQIINGVTKTATCKVLVQPAVTNVTLDPKELAIDIGESKGISAIVTPGTLHGVKLKWMSSDTSVVNIVDTQDKFITIKGITGGMAVITAINEQNTVVGFCKVTVKQPVQSITLSETNITLPLSNGSFTLRTTVLPASATDKSVRFTSTNEAVATVDNDGKVSLKSAGSTSIIVSSVNNPKVQAICNVTVTTAVTGVTILDNKITMSVGENRTLSYNVIPASAHNKTVAFSSSDTSVVSVGNDGKLTASAPGVAIITVKTADGGFAATCTVTVTQKSTNITLNKTELTIYSETTFTLVPTITPANSTDEITWETTNSKVATVSNKGVISGKAKGSTLIIAKTSSGLTAYCKVTVKQRAKGIELNYTTKTVAKGNKFTLKAAVLPLDASNKKVTFTSSNTKVATVNADGVVKGLKGGTTVITVETVDGGYKATCVVTVKELVTEISLKKDLMVAKGYVGTLKPVIKSNSATTTKIKWTSSNNKIVKVNQKGVITAVGYGTATITVRATDGSGAIAKCKVKVIRKVTSISINKTAVNIIVGDSLTVKATVKPNNSTYRGVIWSSSNENVAVVNDKGKITAIAEGNCIIYAKAKDNSKKSAKLIVTVTKKVASSGITVANQELTLVRGERKLVQTVLSPANTTDGIRWSSDNNAVATVDKKTGLIVAKSVGTAVITVMTDSGKTARITVTVVGLSKSSLTLEQYSTYTLWVEGAKNVKWDVENPNVATVVNGKVTSRAIGKTRIIASVNGRKLYCTLRVTKIA